MDGSKIKPAEITKWKNDQKERNVLVKRDVTKSVSLRVIMTCKRLLYQAIIIKYPHESSEIHQKIHGFQVLLKKKSLDKNKKRLGKIH